MRLVLELCLMASSEHICRVWEGVHHLVLAYIDDRMDSLNGKC